MQSGQQSALMKSTRRGMLIGGCALAALMLASPRFYRTCAQQMTSDSSRALTRAFAALGGKLYSVLSSKPGNLVFSPYSIGTAMAMAMSGARGLTEKELANVLELPLTRQETEEASSKVLATLNSYDKSSDPHFCPQDSRWTGIQCEAPPTGDRKCRFPMQLAGGQCVGGPTLPTAQLLVANALMLAKYGYLVSADYRALVQERYKAEVFSEAKLEDVNAWVKRKTNGKITHILDRLDPLTVMVLLNAVYFKAAWASPFAKAETREDVFHLSPAAKIKTPVMHQVNHFSVVAGPGYRAIELSYSEPALSMVIVVPDKVDGLSSVASGLGGDGAAKLLATFEPAPSKKVALSLPRFKSSSDIDLMAPFRALGLNLALSDEADFGGIMRTPAGERRIKIRQIHHRALIEVQEEGTEAAAATAVVMAGRGRLPEPEPEPEAFVVDRPFLFFVADAASGAVLFQGRVTDPSQQA
jgi:serpin B